MIGLSVVALTAWVLLLYQPASRQLASTRAQVASLEQDLSNARRFLTETAAAMETGNWLQQRRDLMMGLYRADSLESFIDQMADDCLRIGVTRAEFLPNLNELLKQQRIPIGNIILTGGRFEGRCQGRFLNLGRALEHLEQQPYFVELYSLNIAYNQATSPDVLCTMDFAVYLRDREGTRD